MLRRLLFSIALIAMVLPAAAVAHVTLQPGEWEAGSFAALVVRVPNERDDARCSWIAMGMTRYALRSHEGRKTSSRDGRYTTGSIRTTDISGRGRSVAASLRWAT